MKRKKRSKIAKQTDNLNYFVIILIAICTLGFFVGSALNYSGVYREIIAETGFVALLLYGLYSNRKVKSINATLSATRLWLVALFLLATISFFWSDNIGFFLSKYLLWLGAAAVFLLALNFKAEQKTFTTLVKTLTFIGFYVSAIGLFQFLSGVDIFTHAIPPAANFVNKNMAAQVIVLVFPISVFLLLSNQKMAALSPFIMALMLAYVFHTQTRAAWLSISVEILLLLVFFVIYRKNIKQSLKAKKLHWSPQHTLNSALAFMILLLLISLSPTGWHPFWDVLSQRFDAIVNTAQNVENARYQIWQAALLMIEQSPWFGSGMGSFYNNIFHQTTTAHTNIGMTVVRVHNDGLELGVELGIIGLAIFIAVVIALLMNLFKLIRHHQDTQQLFYLLLGVALSGSFANMQFSFPYQLAAPLMIFALYSGMIVKASDNFNSNIKQFKITKAIYHNLSFALLAIVLILILIINVGWLNTLTTMDNNIKKQHWSDPINNNPLNCQKTVVYLLNTIEGSEPEKRHYFDLGRLNSLNQCVPDSWHYYRIKAYNLMQLNRIDEAIVAAQQAKKIHPRGNYQDYVNQFILYNKANKPVLALALYQQLTEQPEHLLAIKNITFHQLSQMALQLNKIKQATHFYQLYIKYHGENLSLKNLIEKAKK